MQRRIVIAAPKSGSGKTLITCSLLKAMKDKGLDPCSFKCGPDYIDPMFHERVLNIASANLDLYFTDEEMTKSLFNQNYNGDIAVIEGVMGLFDGVGGITSIASTYHLAKTLEAPIIMVIDARGMGISVAALLKGFCQMDDCNLIKGVILNNTSEYMCNRLKPVIEKETGVEVLGYFTHNKEFSFESRHLGLHMPGEINNIENRIQLAADEIKKTVNVDKIIELSENVSICKCLNEFKIENICKDVTPCIAVARDAAFNFYYKDNISLLEKLGARIITFSPLADKECPIEADGIILGGGYPEEFAKTLSDNVSMRNSIKNLIENGIPIHAECGGFLYLHNELVTKDKESFEMAGVISGKAEYTGKLVRFGYVEIENIDIIENETIRGHEFHYYDSTNNGEAATCVKPVSGKKWNAMHISDNQIMGFPHLYYYSNINFAVKFVEACCKYKQEKTTHF